MTPETFRKLALALPESYESFHVDHPDFRIGRKVFATLGYPDAAWGVVKLTPEQQAEIVAAHPTVFVPVAGAWGRKGSTNVKLRPATQELLRPALAAAWRNVAPATLARKHAQLNES